MGLRREVGQRGFTLLELLVTLVLVALAVAMVVPAIGRSTDTLRSRSEVARFSALLRHAREQSITTQRGHAVVIDPVAHRAVVLAGADEVQETRALPADMRIVASPPTAFIVRFEPSGVSSGGDFLLTSGQVSYRVTVAPLTGRVRVERQ